MHLDSLVRLIQAADPSVFREVAFLCLAKRGFEPSLVDGPHDGGADFLVHVLPPSSSRFAVQVSVEKNWERKLRSDASTAKKALGIDKLLFLTSCVLTPALFQEIADDLQRTLDVQIQKMDAKDIASLAELRGFTGEILRAFEIIVPAPAPRPFQPPDLRQNVAYACAFFGTEAQTFRRSVIENATLTVAFQAGGSAERETIVARAALGLGLSSNQRVQVTSAIDRMLQDGRLAGKNGVVAIDATTRDTLASVAALKERDREALGEAVEALLAPNLKRPVIPEAVQAILENLGALFLDMGQATSSSLGAAESGSFVQEPLRPRLRRLDATLDTLGIVDKKARGILLQSLVALAASSPFGQALAASEVFIHLLQLQTPHLFRALGAWKELRVVLDTSVAMPLLSSLLYDPAGQDFFVAGKHVYEQLVAHQIEMILPRDYLEEVASHLLDASLLYRDIIDLDPDLRGSKNAFVAHYVALRLSDEEAAVSYATYLAGFGLRESMMRGDRTVEREILMKKLEGLFALYNIHVKKLAPSPPFAKKAQEALAYAMRARNDLERPAILVRHDATTLGWLLEQAPAGSTTQVICTWDRLHPHVRDREGGDWDVLDPVALGDILSIAAPESEKVTFVSPVFVALSLSSEAEKSGAAIWDQLVEIEKEKLHDTVLLAAARAFKQAWVTEAAKDRRARTLQEAWEAWKSAHLPAVPS